MPGHNSERPRPLKRERRPRQEAAHLENQNSSNGEEFNAKALSKQFGRGKPTISTLRAARRFLAPRRSR
jgi:hypothetical protein